MRGIPPFKYLSGLQPVAAEAVKNAGTGLADAANRAQAQMDECERAIQDAQNTTTALETTLIGESKQVLQDAGLGLAALRELSSQSFDTEHDPCLRFLYSLQRDKQIEGTTSSTQAAVLELRSLAARARFLQDACLLVTGYGRSSEGTKVARRTGLFFAPCGKGDRAVARCPFCANSFVARSPRFEAVGRIKCAASLIAAAIRVLVSK
jgi:hypothetical protein